MRKNITVSKSQFKAQAKVIPYKEEDPEDILKSLRGSVIYYKDPDKPAIDPEDWEVLK